MGKITKIRQGDTELDKEFLENLLHPEQVMSLTRKGVIIGLGAGAIISFIFGPEILDHIITTTGLHNVSYTISQINDQVMALTDVPGFKNFMISRIVPMATIIPTSMVVGAVVGGVGQLIQSVIDTIKFRRGPRSVD